MFITTPAFKRFNLAFAIFIFCSSEVMAQEIVWPNTFNGQPEFSFDKKDLQEEPNKAVAGHGKVVQSDPVAAMSLLIKRSVADPFATQQIEAAPEVNLQGPRLNDLLTNATADLAKFKSFVDGLIDRETNLDLSAYDFAADVRRIVIQSLVSSPTAYVMINAQRYTEGDEFTLHLLNQDESARVASIINDEIPDKSIISDALYAAHIKIRDDAIAEYKRRLQAQNSFAGSHKVSVAIKKIRHRELTVSILDKDYVLKLGTAL